MYMQDLYITTMLNTACFQATAVPHALTQLPSAYDFSKKVSRHAFMYKWIYICPYYPTNSIKDAMAWAGYISVRIVSVHYIVYT